MTEAKKDEVKKDEMLEQIQPDVSGLAEDGVEFMDDLTASIDRLTSERDDMRDRWMRALADAENSRKRGERDRREAEQYGSAKFSRDMLPVYDSLKRALDSVTDEQRAAASALLDGVELTLRELGNIFAKHGIVIISPAIGSVFDPQQHQAMFEAPLPGTKAGEIIQVMGEGFMLHERLLRPAQVGVSSNTAKN